jgi:hypothetical protein
MFTGVLIVCLLQKLLGTKQLLKPQEINPAAPHQRPGPGILEFCGCRALTGIWSKASAVCQEYLQNDWSAPAFSFWRPKATLRQYYDLYYHMC